MAIDESFITGSTPASLPGQGAGGGGGGATTLGALTDVSATPATDKQVLRWNNSSSEWEPVNRSIAALNDSEDVNAPSPTDKYHLRWDSSSSEWVPSNRALGVEGVDAASNEQYYGKNGAGVIGFHTVAAGASALDDLSDVDTTTTAPSAEKPILRWSVANSQWEVSNTAAVSGDDAGVFLLVGQTVAESYTVPANMTAITGTFTVAATKVVTVSAGARVVVV